MEITKSQVISLATVREYLRRVMLLIGFLGAATPAVDAGVDTAPSVYLYRWLMEYPSRLDEVRYLPDNLQAVILRTYGDNLALHGFLANARPLGGGGSASNCADATVRLDWVRDVQVYYDRVNHLVPAYCTGCYATLAQIYYMASDIDGALAVLRSAINGTADQRLRAVRLYLLAKYAIAIGQGRDCYARPICNIPAVLRQAWSELSALGHPDIVAFDRARLFFTDPSESDNVESSLRLVLDQHPSHALSQFLLAIHLLRHREHFGAEVEALGILRDLERRMASPALDGEDPGLGELDYVKHTVPFDAVLERFFEAALVSCSEPDAVLAFRDAVSSGLFSTHVLRSWLNADSLGYRYVMFPQLAPVTESVQISGGPECIGRIRQMLAFEYSSLLDGTLE